MGGDLYIIECFYGYEIKIDPSSFSDVLHILSNFHNIGDSRFEFAAILSELDSRMEGMSDKEARNMYKNSSVIIGFKTMDDLSEMIKYVESLQEHITKKHLFPDIKFYENPKFFYGLNVIESIYEIF